MRGTSAYSNITIATSLSCQKPCNMMCLFTEIVSLFFILLDNFMNSTECILMINVEITYQ